MSALVITDLDGTLLRSDGSVSSFTIDTLNRLIDSGLAITYATARTFEKASSLTSDIEIRLPSILLNGAVIGSPDGRLMRTYPLSMYASVAAIGIGKEYGLSPFVLGMENARDVVLYEGWGNQFEAFYIEQRKGERRMTRTSVVAPLPVTFCVALMGSQEVLERIAKILQDRLPRDALVRITGDVYFPGGYTLEVHNAKADKGLAVIELCELLKVDPSNLVVIGDHTNDLSMLTLAGTSVAVANAHATVLEHVQTRIRSNDEDGVAHYLWARYGL